MGEVYRARDPRVGRDVAIKVSAERFSERFEREARAIAALNHPNICTLYDVGPNYLVMEFVEGEAPKGPLPPETALRYARQIADALEAAHEKGIVHRDLKPGNIKIKPDDTVKVLDFGLAKVGGTVAAPADDSPTLTNAATQAGVILGTAAYMSPEQARGKPVDKRADIWAFGCVLFEMITGRRPFKGEDVGETLAAVIKEQPRWEGVPTHVRPLVESCLEKDPRKRLRDIGDAWRLLESVPRIESQGQPERHARPRWLPWIVAAIMTLAAAGTAGYVLTRPVPATLSAQFTVYAPQATKFRYEITGAAVSPNGQFLVFSAFQERGNSLYVRPLNALEARPLPGTEDADFPFWSPDSSSIAFFADGKLKRVEIAGGTPVVVCETRGAYGAWSRDDVILFGSRDGVYRVAASGGVPSLVTRRDDSAQERAHVFPQFLPDGEHFLYFVDNADSNKQGVYASSLNRPQDRAHVLSTAYRSVYAPPVGGRPGRLLFLRDSTLMAQPFDASALRLEGEPTPVADGITLAPNSRTAAFWVSDAGLLMYRNAISFGSYAGRSKLVWVSRSGKRLEDAAPEDDYSSLRISPDGTRAALGRRNAARLDDIWVLEFARGTMSRFTFDPRRETWPVWSPDGRQIAFASSRSGTYQVYKKDARGAGNEEQLTQTGFDKILTDWSRDGRYLLYDEDGGWQIGSDIWALPLEGDRKPMPVLQTSFAEEAGQFSPDGNWIAYQSDESGQPEVYVQAFPSSGGRWQVSTSGGRSPRWRADGKELFYATADSQKMMAVEILVASGSVKAGTPQELFSTAMSSGITYPYDVTADGQRFLVQELVPQTEPPSLTVVVNWQAGLK